MAGILCGGSICSSSTNTQSGQLHKRTKRMRRRLCYSSENVRNQEGSLMRWRRCCDLQEAASPAAVSCLSSEVTLSGFIMAACSVSAVFHGGVKVYLQGFYRLVASPKPLHQARGSRTLPPSYDAGWQAISDLYYREDSQG